MGDKQAYKIAIKFNEIPKYSRNIRVVAGKKNCEKDRVICYKMSRKILRGYILQICHSKKVLILFYNFCVYLEKETIFVLFQIDFMRQIDLMRLHATLCHYCIPVDNSQLR